MTLFSSFGGAPPRRVGRLVATGILFSSLAVGCADNGADAPGASDSQSGDEAAEDLDESAAVATPGSYCAAKPVIEKYCTSCHDGNGTGGSPMGLTTAADFQKAAPISSGKKNYQAVSARVHDTARPMPPRGLMPAADLAVLDAWLKAGAPAGSDATCSGGGTDAGHGTDGGHSGTDGGVKDPNDGWDPSKCDEIVEIRAHGPGGANTPYTVPRGAEIHPQIKVAAPWGNEQVQVIGFKPITDNQKVLHHWILNGPGRQFLAGWAPGDDTRPPFPDNVGMSMPTGPNAFVLDMHYYNTTGTKAETDRSGVALCVIKKAHFRPQTAAVTMGFTSLGSGLVLAPRNSVNKPTTGTCKVRATQPVHLLTAAPHAHKYASRMRFVVKKKNGQEIVMHDEPFKFGEQGTYPLKGGEVILQTGDTVTTTCYYTNPTNRNITFGESTENEMCFNFALYYPKGALSCSLF